MDWKDIGQALVNIAPTIAGTLVSLAPVPGAGLAAPLVSMAVRELEKALGLEVTGGSSPDEINAALATTSPETLLALKKADQQFQLDLKKANIDLESVFQKDRDSARQREMAVKDKVPGRLMYMLTFGFFGLLGLMCFLALPEVNQTVLNVMVGTLGTAWLAGVYYYYGTSRGSERKTEIMAEQGDQK